MAHCSLRQTKRSAYYTLTPPAVPHPGYYPSSPNSPVPYPAASPQLTYTTKTRCQQNSSNDRSSHSDMLHCWLFITVNSTNKKSYRDSSSDSICQSDTLHCWSFITVNSTNRKSYRDSSNDRSCQTDTLHCWSFMTVNSTNRKKKYRDSSSDSILSVKHDALLVIHHCKQY